jgi:V/A-type H+-transporting ATPase subunit E
MSIENLKTSLQKSAELEIQDILQKARGEAEEIINEAKTKIDQDKKTKLEARVEELRKKGEIELSTVRSRQRLALLSVKEGLVQQIFTDAMKRLEEAAEGTEPRYVRFLRDSVLKGVTTLTGDKFVIFSNENDKKALEKALAGIKKIMENKGKHVVLELNSKNMDTIGGVVICTQDRNRCYNITLEARLDEFRETHASEVTEILLEED